MGTDQLDADLSGYVGSMEGERQHGGAMGGCVRGAGAASCFPRSELQVESQAGVAREDATAGDGVDGGLMVSERQQGGVGHSGNLGEITAAGCFPGPELRVGSQAGGGRSAAGTRQLCGSAGTDQLSDDRGRCMYVGGGMC